MKKVMRVFPLAVLLMLGAGGTGRAAPAHTTAAPTIGIWVGTVTGTNAFVAIVAGKHGSLSYVCDGRTLALWFRQQGRSGSGLRVTAAAGAVLVAKMSAAQASGTVRIGGSLHHFAAARAHGRAGLFRGEGTSHGKRLVGGWIILNSGKQRGLVTSGTTPVATPPLHLTSGASATVHVAGTAMVVRFIDPTVSL